MRWIDLVLLILFTAGVVLWTSGRDYKNHRLIIAGVALTVGAVSLLVILRLGFPSPVK